jgi:molecular chaperone DnaK (HSP70)
MGRRFDSPEVTAMRQRVGYAIEPAEDGGVKVRLGDSLMTPVEVSAIILQVARQIAEKQIGEPVDEAVVTVPAYFSHAQREATFKAAQLAGLKCERLLNEPTAAALAYGNRRNMEKTILVFDLGGGTLDVCVLRLSTGVYEILATNGDTFLGGEDFDFRLLGHLADTFQVSHGVDLRKEPVALQRLKDAAERAKCELSFTDRTTVLIPRVHQAQNLEIVVSRASLEALVEDLVARSIALIRETVAEAGLGLGQIDDVLLVGGQTRMPKVREAIATLFGKEPNRSIHPEEVVAIGAAVHASSLTDASISAPILLDVTPFDLGIDTVGGLFAPVISKNSKVPTSKTRTFVTVHDNQDQVRVVVRQGDSSRTEENEFLGEFVMQGLTPAPRMETRVDVSFRLDVNGMLHVHALEQGKKDKCQITIRNYARFVKARTGATGEPVKPEVVEALRGGHAGPQGVLSAGGPSTSLLSPDAVAPEPAEPDARARKSRLTSVLDRLMGKREATRPSAPIPPAADPAQLVKDVQLVGSAPDEPVADAWSASSSDPGARIDLSAVRPEPIQLEEADVEAIEAEAQEEIRTLGMHEPPPLAPSIGLAGEGVIPPAQSADAAPSSPSYEDPLLASSRETPALDDLFGDIPPGPTPSSGQPKGASRYDPPADAFPSWEDLLPIEEPVAPQAPPRSPPAEASRPKKPARLKMKYASDEALLKEWRAHLEQASVFVRAVRPLAVGRLCTIEIEAPGLPSRLAIEGRVTWSSADLDGELDANEQGMRVDFDLSSSVRLEIETMLDRLELMG